MPVVVTGVARSARSGRAVMTPKARQVSVAEARRLGAATAARKPAEPEGATCRSVVASPRPTPASGAVGQQVVAALEPLLPRLVRRGRVPGLRTARATVAAVVAFLVSVQLGTSPDPVLAPLTALLVVQFSVSSTFAKSVERVASVLAGVLVALAVAAHAGLTWLSLAAVVAASLVAGPTAAPRRQRQRGGHQRDDRLGRQRRPHLSDGTGSPRPCSAPPSAS